MPTLRVLANTSGLSEEEWLDYRRKGIGGSDAAAIAGVSSWKNAVTIYLDKIGQGEKREVGEAAYWGHIHEVALANEFAKRNGCEIKEISAILQHPEYEWMLANIDRGIIDPELGYGILECKSTGAFTTTAAIYLEDERGEAVANEHYVQVQWYLAVTGLQWAVVVILVGGNRYFERFVKRDQETIDYLIKIGTDFWELVQAKQMPAIDDTDESTKILDYLYPKSAETSIELESQYENVCQELLNAKAAIKEAEAREQAASNTLKALMKDNSLAFCGQFQLSWNSISTRKFQQKKLQEAEPDKYEKYCEDSSYRRFTIKVKKEKKNGKGRSKKS